MSTISVATPTFSAVPVVHPSPKKWTRTEVYRLMDEGWFENQQIELIDGGDHSLATVSGLLPPDSVKSAINRA